MATAAQIKANRENAQKSSGPTSDSGKEKSCRNNFHHGLTGSALIFLEWENPANFDELWKALKEEHQPRTATELLLVEKMAQHYWLSQRALTLQTREMAFDPCEEATQKTVANFARYQALHDRLFQRALHDLLNLRAEKRKEQIGFESQERAHANETRKAETHKLKTAMLETKLEREKLRNPQRERSTECTNQPNPEHQPRINELKTHSIAA